MLHHLQSRTSTGTDSLIGSGHQSPGLWRHPEDCSWKFQQLEHWTRLAQELEKYKFHGVFIADVLGRPALSKRQSQT